MLTAKQNEYLEAQGWTILCESPLEIEYINPDYPQDGATGFASGQAARDLIAFMLAEMNQEDGTQPVTAKD
jgi:hypothetical protein